MSEYPWDEKSNTFTWLSSLYNLFKGLTSAAEQVLLVHASFKRNGNLTPFHDHDESSSCEPTNV